ncbi:MAG TPA: hypothetical protein VFP94_04425, partial [Terriglobales bacterium]|nr:hypothetical protein [Terriglobales bacterium]
SVARRQRPQALASLDRLWAEEGDGAAIGLVFQLSRAMAMAWVVRQQRASDRRALYQVLPEGLRPPGFAADSILALARHMDEDRLTLALRQLHQADAALRASPPSARLLFEQMVLALTA